MTERIALQGGRPARKEFLPLSRPQLDEEDIHEVLKTLRSGWLTTGPKAQELEEGIKRYIGCRHAIAVNSGTSALLLSIEAAEIKPGDEVITTPLAWLSSAHAIEHHGARPIFVDVDKESYQIDPKLIQSAVTKKTKGILPVHLAGRLCEMDIILDIAKKNNLMMIEDAAHAFEGFYKGRKIGTLSDMTCFSLYATKNLFAGEGGVVTTDNDKLAERIRMSRLFGMHKNSWKRYAKEGNASYDVSFLGHKCNLSDVHAAIALRQLDKIETRLKTRKSLFERYRTLLADIPEIILPPRDPPHIKNSHHLFSILADTDRLTCDRDEFAAALQAENIGTGIHFLSLHLLTYYKNKYNLRKGDFPNAEFYSQRTISLPLSPFLSPRDVGDVANAVRKVATFYRK
ncbi:MAG TPA: DegT/DnrJ/EryC1/StrS family aminotransferase [Candidatus Nanoarchaeia archaeon]|nr:DegT/DnrJ/EryC1/StrS family aminotransferase [Candidatus Nanoarchaeia archaeon]